MNGAAANRAPNSTDDVVLDGTTDTTSTADVAEIGSLTVNQTSAITLTGVNNTLTIDGECKFSKGTIQANPAVGFDLQILTKLTGLGGNSLERMLFLVLEPRIMRQGRFLVPVTRKLVNLYFKSTARSPGRVLTSEREAL